MSVSRAWGEWLERHKAAYIGGDVEETDDPAGTFRGPIKDIVLEKGVLTFVVGWMARQDIDDSGSPNGQWTKVDSPTSPPFSYHIGLDDPLIVSGPTITGRHTHFESMYAQVRLYPRNGGERLYRARVRGV